LGCRVLKGESRSLDGAKRNPLPGLAHSDAAGKPADSGNRWAICSRDHLGLGWGLNSNETRTHAKAPYYAGSSSIFSVPIRVLAGLHARAAEIPCIPKRVVYLGMS